MEPSQAPEVVKDRDLPEVFRPHHQGQFVGEHAQHYPDAAPDCSYPEIAEGSKGKTYQARGHHTGPHRRCFWLLITLGGIFLFAAGSGVGAGTAVAVKNSQHQPIASSSTTTNSSDSTGTVFTAPVDVYVNTSCPAVDGLQQKVVKSSKVYFFMPTCGVNNAGGDLARINAYSLSDCLLACATINDKFWQEACTGATFVGNMTEFRSGNCFLKNDSTTAQVPKYTDTVGVALVQ